MKILISIPESLVAIIDERCRVGGFSRSEYIRSLIRGSVPEIKFPNNPTEAPLPLEEFSKQFTKEEKRKAREANEKMLKKPVKPKEQKGIVDGLCKHGKFGYCVEGCFK